MQPPKDYDPAICDLCGNREYSIVLDLPNTSLTSDCQLTHEGLRKYECTNCKLVRNGFVYGGKKLNDHYESYTLAQKASVAEPMFFTKEGVIPRSQLIFQWISSNLTSAGFPNPQSIVEIGCGEGSLLNRFAATWPNSAITGIDMSAASLEHAKAKGLRVQQGSYNDVVGLHDLIYSFAVIEHVPSPMHYLTELASHLKPGGLLVTAQPCQDYGSNDIYFTDHLHHFFSHHVTDYGRRVGLVELAKAVKHPLMADFSLHIFSNRGSEPARTGPAPAVHDVRSVIRSWDAVFAGIDEWLAATRRKRLAVWGVGQTFRMMSAYSQLRNYPISLGFDDNAKRYAADFSFPIVPFESAENVDPRSVCVLLTFKPKPLITQDLYERGFDFCSPLDYLQSP